MIATSRLIKAIDTDALVVFVGPCIAKKTEKAKTADTDFVITFEELAAMIEAKGIDLEKLDPSPLNNASAYGRGFAAVGGVTQAIENHLSEKSITDVMIHTANGITECDKYLKLLKFKRLEGDFIEGMACKGGCIKGPVTMHHGNKDLKSINQYAQLAMEKNPADATRVFTELAISLT